MNLFEGMFSVIDQALDRYIINTATDLIAYITPMFTSMLIVWIAIWGYLMMFGKVSEPLQEGVFRILRIGFIMTLGLTVGTYMGVVVDVLASRPGKGSSSHHGVQWRRSGHFGQPVLPRSRRS
ncbi:type IV secretion system protein [Halomonas garicola]|uniref:type IV secretion system protein n=1 Tax=Halomonas garicola TaxID=1690008 RepID=UPI00289EC9CB|nr:type IV secretion system protein [Halomonas garicola]